MASAVDLSSYSFVQAKKEFDDARQHVVDDGWEEYVNSSDKGDTIKIWRKHDAASGLYMYKVIGVLKDVSLEDFRGVVNDLEYRCAWDVYTHSLGSVKEVEAVVIDPGNEEHKTEGGDLIQWRVKFNFPFISDREYLFTRHVAILDDTIVFLDKQAPDDWHPAKKSVTRVANYNNAICLHQVGNDVVMGQDYLTALDLRMSLPNWLINWAAGAGVKGILGLYREAIQKYPGWKEGDKKATKKK